MRGELERLIREWDGLAAVARYDEPTGSWIFIALHDDTLGRPVGGCRMMTYETPADGLRDAMRLARGMTHKWASIEMGFGGGKAVLAVPGPLEGEPRDGLLRRFGALLDSLRGSYATGEDLGTTPRDMQVVAGSSRWVMGVDPDEGEPADPGPYTALGVLSGIRAALEHLNGDPSLSGRRILVQGVGDVGEPLSRMVADAGGRLLLSDLDGPRAERLARELDGEVVPPADVVPTACDVFAPCAVGGVLNRDAIPGLRCRAVAGSANNQLATGADAERLRERGILYAPDYVVNAGGALAFGLMHEGVDDEEEIRSRVRGLGDALRAIFREASERDESPLAAARRKVRRVLARGAQASRVSDVGKGRK